MAKRGFTGVVMRSYGVREHEVTVLGRELLAPHVVRVRLSSPTLFQDAMAAPTAWLRFWFPDPYDGTTEHQRAYTISSADEATGEFAIDMVLHEPTGPASAWARDVEPGRTIIATSLGSSRFAVPDDPPAGYLLIGDSASIPAINTILDTVPAHVPVEVYLEQHTEDDPRIPVTAHPRSRVHWVPRRGPASLAAAIEGRDWSNWYAWAGPEAGSLKHLRTRLRDEFGFPKSELYAQAYWYHGRPFGKLRGPSEPEPEATPQPDVSGAGETRTEAPTTSKVRGSWRAQGAGRLLAPLRRTLILSGVLQALVTLVQLAPYVLLVELARQMLAGAGAPALWTLGGWAVGLVGVGTLLGAALVLWLHAADARFARGVRQRLLGKLARLPLGWFTTHGSGHVKQVVQDDTLALHYLVTHAIPDATAAVVAPVAVMVYLFGVDWPTALALLLPVLVYVVVMWVMVVQSGARTGKAMWWAERMNREAAGFLEGQPVIRVFGGAAASTFRARLGEYVRFLDDWQRPFSGKKALIDLVTRPATFLLLIAVIGTWRITSGAMDALSLLPFLFLGTTFGARLLGIGYGLSGLRAGLLAGRRIQATLDEPELETRVATIPEATDGPGTVVFDRVGFAYRPGVPVIEEFSLVLRPGTVTALVGPSGSGKSTLAALLARFFDVSTGAIRVGGHDVRDLSGDDLYRQVGFVFQQTQLVHGTVHENIALAVPDATRQQVEEAARAAHIQERIRRLPNGFDTVLEPDAALSGGERQRLAIARTILADPAVLVLDEATAYADPESEYAVQQALNRLAAGRTVLVIAHRLHTVTEADHIVVLDGGRLVEAGTHAELHAAGGRYRQLWEAGRSRPMSEEVAR
ncbi:ATP-binding cassette domain-containing protein [Micromonospora sp. WMMD1076]|uniref:ABC transporter ATP-binding protein/permease n=1 Tax=Micromonospora sp. WMMD1076 TaxID=3016103 RepID=UPI002499B5FB|nr:ABC transporter ATP-binding protein/permease [Micromonospora sp. WMMD1076]WFF08929.1 ATP-binding cassette domain-containing protein [Micromonospora sp. WMMD1076]